MEDGIKALKWAVEYPLALGYESWSVETVVSTVTRRVLDALVVKHTPECLGYLQVEAADLGTPQTRLRYIVGPPQLIERLNAQSTVARVSVRAAFKAQNIDVPSTHVKNSNKASKLRSVDDVAFTCCASRALSWCTADGTTVHSMRPSETRVLMGLDSSFKLVGGQRVEQRVLGNGVAFHVARAVAVAARADEDGDATSTADGATSSEDASAASLERRVEILEARLEALEKRQRIS